MDAGDRLAWGADWAWGLPLILLTVVFHAYCLSRIVEDVSDRLDGQQASGISRRADPYRWRNSTSATILHGIEGVSRRSFTDF